VDAEREAGVGAERGVLVERDRVVGPGSVHGGARDEDDLADAGRGGGLQRPSGTTDVDPGHEVLIGDGVVDAGEVDEDIGALEQRPQIRTGHVDEVELQLAGSEARLPHVEADHPPDGRRPGETPEHGLTQETRYPRDHHRARGTGGVPPTRAAGAAKVRGRHGGGVAIRNGGIPERRSGVARSLHPHRLAA
jgi:hypothetical protein